jgi:hypothetical protein
LAAIAVSQQWLIPPFRPPIEHARPLPDGQMYSRPLLDEPCEDVTGFFQIVAGVEQNRFSAAMRQMRR